MENKLFSYRKQMTDASSIEYYYSLECKKRQIIAVLNTKQVSIVLICSLSPYYASYITFGSSQYLCYRPCSMQPHGRHPFHPFSKCVGG